MARSSLATDRQHAVTEVGEEIVVSWVGACRYHHAALNWEGIIHCGDSVPTTPHPVRSAQPAKIAAAIGPLASARRIQVLSLLAQTPLRQTVLAARLGLQPGALEYHLRALLAVGYIQKQQGRYDITPDGCRMLVMFTSLAAVACEQADSRSETESAHDA